MESISLSSALASNVRDVRFVVCPFSNVLSKFCVYAKDDDDRCCFNEAIQFDHNNR